jgi:predicted nucleotidyltransferase
MQPKLNMPLALCEQVIALLQEEINELKMIIIFGSVASCEASSDGDVDLVDLCEASTMLRLQIVTKGQQVFGNANELSAYAAKTYSTYQWLQAER